MLANITTVFAGTGITEDTDYASAMTEKGILKGYSADNYGLSDCCTREQFITFLYRTAGEPHTEKKANFADVSDNACYSDAVARANNNGITNGSGDRQGSVTYSVFEDVNSQLLKAFTKTANGDEYHLFFVLRPSQSKY